jgi:putative SOS response-associated peptidase YedK
MCGRARLAADHSETKIRAFIGPTDMPNIRPSWNIAPTQDVLGVTSTPHGVKTARMDEADQMPGRGRQKTQQEEVMDEIAEANFDVIQRAGLAGDNQS